MLFKEHIEQSVPGVKFSQDYITYKADTLASLLAEFKNKPQVRYLEVGVFEGLTTLWFLKNILTHKTSRADLVDNFYDSETAYMIPNLKKAKVYDRCRILKGSSHDVLRTLKKNQYDIIMVDGAHRAVDVIQDLVLAWPLLKVGGYMLIDDYEMQIDHEAFITRQAIDPFLDIFKNDLEIIYKDYFILVKKLEEAHAQGEFDHAPFLQSATGLNKKRIYNFFLYAKARAAHWWRS